MSIMAVAGLGIDFGGVTAVDALDFEVQAGEVLSIIGPNGAGKTTLFNMISGLYLPARGQVFLDGQDVTGFEPHRLARMGLSRTFQNLQIFHKMTVLENVMAGRHLSEDCSLLSDLLGLPGAHRNNRKTKAQSLLLLERVGLSRAADNLASELSYGALKRLEIARALACGPRILLLDEPAAGCNAVETQEVDNLIVDIAREGIAVVLVEHDMKLVMKISNHVVVLDYGKKLAEGSPQTVIRNPEVIEAYLGIQAVAEEHLAPH